jgi:hypothetical protein
MLESPEPSIDETWVVRGARRSAPAAEHASNSERLASALPSQGDVRMLRNQLLGERALATLQGVPEGQRRACIAAEEDLETLRRGLLSEREGRIDAQEGWRARFALPYKIVAVQYQLEEEREARTWAEVCVAEREIDGVE